MGISDNLGSEMVKYLWKTENVDPPPTHTFPRQFLETLFSLCKRPERNQLHLKSWYYINCIILCLWTFCASCFTLAKVIYHYMRLFVHMLYETSHTLAPLLT